MVRAAGERPRPGLSGGRRLRLRPPARPGPGAAGTESPGVATAAARRYCSDGERASRTVRRVAALRSSATVRYRDDPAGVLRRCGDPPGGLLGRAGPGSDALVG